MFIIVLVLLTDFAYMHPSFILVGMTSATKYIMKTVQQFTTVVVVVQLQHVQQ